MASLDSKVSSVLGDRTSKVLETTFGIKSVADLLRHYPRRYAVRGELTDISTLQEGDEVILASGIYGFISAIEDGYVWLDIAEKVEIRVARSAIATKVSTPSSGDQASSDKNEKK